MKEKKQACRQEGEVAVYEEDERKVKIKKGTTTGIEPTTPGS